MAVYTVSNAGGNYNAGATWVGGIVPSTTDTVAFTSTSGNLTINVASTCAGIDFTNYVRTLTLNNTLTCNGNINLGTGGYNVAGATTLYAGATGTITSNGTAWQGNFGFIGTAQIFTLADDLTVNGTITISVTTLGTLNGFTLYANSSWSHASAANFGGTTNLVFNGTGFWSHSAGYLGLNTTINTSGTITLGTNVRYNTGILTYTAGIVVTTNSTLIIGSTCTLDTSGMTWNNLTTAVVASINLISILVVGGTLTIGGASFITNPCHVKGNLVITSNTGTSGKIILNGTGNQTWSGTQMVRGTLQINKPSGILTVSGSVSFGNGILTYISGNVITTGSTLSIPTICTINTNGINWNTIIFSGGAVRTLSSDLTCNTLNVTGGASTTNGSSIYFNNLAYNTTAGTIGLGTTTFVFNGTGNWSHATTGRFNNNLIIDTGVSGVTTFTQQTYITNGTVTHISGTVNQGVYTLTLAGSATMDTSGMTWGVIYVNGGVTTLLSTLKADNIQNNGFTTMTFAGAFGFEVDNFRITTPFNVTVTLVNGVRYLVKQSLVTNTSGYTRLFTCASGAALLDLQYGATQNLANTSATRINSLGGQTIYTTGTLTSTQNWNTGTYRNPTNFMIMF